MNMDREGSLFLTVSGHHDRRDYPEDIRLALLHLFRGLGQGHHPCGGIIGGWIFIVKAHDHPAHRIIGLVPVLVALNGLMQLPFQQHDAAEQNGVNNLLLALEIDIQRGFAVLRFPGNVIHRGLFRTLFRKQPLRSRQDGAAMKFCQRLLLAHRNSSLSNSIIEPAV